MLAYTIDCTGFRQYALRVKDLRTQATLPDSTERVTSVAWAADNKTVFATTEDAVTKRSDKLWRHVLGRAAFDPVYEEKDELYDIWLEKTRDKKYIFLGIGAKDTTEFRYLRADQPQGNFVAFLPREKKLRYYPGHHEDRFFFRTNKDAKKLPGGLCAGERSQPEELESLLPAAGRWRAGRHRSFQDFRGGSREIAGGEPDRCPRF